MMKFSVGPFGHTTEEPSRVIQVQSFFFATAVVYNGRAKSVLANIASLSPMRMLDYAMAYWSYVQSSSLFES